ncbi:MAG TPA: TadE family protein [Candidatus Obscuribacterales bacterium]
MFVWRIEKSRRRTAWTRRFKKPARGASLVEFAAAVALLVPTVFIIIFGVVEATSAIMIYNTLSSAAHQAARALAIAYWKDSDVASDRGMQNSQVFDGIRSPNCIVDSRQFDDPTFALGADPPSVTVRVRFRGGQYGLPPFPNPDPLNLGSIELSATATQALD